MYSAFFNNLSREGQILVQEAMEMIRPGYDPAAHLVGSTEANAMENKISNESPVGAAFLKHKVGDTVKVNAPDGEYKLVIKEIF